MSTGRMLTPRTLAEREALDREISVECAWDYIPGDNISAGLLTLGHYVASIRYQPDPAADAIDFGCFVQPRLTLSYRPPGTHEAVGVYASAAALERARVAHADSRGCTS